MVCIDELGWRARTAIEVTKWKGAWPEETTQVRAGCGQEEPGSEISDKKMP